jgi:dihydrofolate reductase
MAKLIYVANVSLDGYIEDAHGSFEWTAPTDEVFTFITDLVRPVGAYLYGRRMYETMAVWEADPTLAAQSELRADFANVWQTADKIVYSTTLHAVSTANTRLERRFDPDSVRDMKTSAASDFTVGGPTLAAHAFNAGLVDECHLFMYRVLVGQGKPAFPQRRPRPVGAAGGTPVRQRCRVPPLPHPELTSRRKPTVASLRRSRWARAVWSRVRLTLGTPPASH